MNGTLVCLGLGYCARHYVAEFGGRHARIVGTARDVTAAQPVRCGDYEVDLLPFDGRAAPPEVVAAVREADALLISAAPGAAGDPVLATLRGALDQAARLTSAVYLSTVGVYGDHAGGFVDEETPVAPLSPRGQARVDAENAWREFGRARGIAVAVLRLAGIYGPGQNPLTSVRDGAARRIAKPGQVFNRIHVADIAQAIDAAIARRADGVFNLADDEATPPGDPIVFAARLLGVDPPPEIPYEVAVRTMSPMAASFYDECKRVRNDRLKTVLGVRLRYPTYREGLRALHAAGE